MTYLLGQMSLALALAVVCGGALGWLIHRARHVRQNDELRHALSRQQQQLSQMQSEVSMLSDDYDELQRRAQDEIAALREDNQKIPFLNTNLEKSQLLVRQMMQRHEAKTRDLNNENRKLAQRVKLLEEKEQAGNRQQATLDNERRLQSGTESTGSVVPADQPRTVDSAQDKDSAASRIDTRRGTAQPTPEEASPAAAQLISDRRNTSSWASASLPATPGQPQARQAHEYSRRSTDSANLDEAGNVDEEDLDEVHVVVADDLQGIDERVEDGDIPDTFPDIETDLNLDLPGEDVQPDGKQHRPIVLDADTVTPTEDEAQLEDTAESVDTDPFDQVIEVGDDLQRELDVDSTQDDTSLFEPVEPHDDLQQIVGIGPVTEKALNELGITSYSQLATLQHHEIEAIANALHIGPERIKRDDWVGNARRQLEDVLEQL
ncbi:MAG: hypothetical protein HKN42_12320 [Granulosicoccus sp.]|nr:hypothetical protein [Granulosicoccus sp.]